MLKLGIDGLFWKITVYENRRSKRHNSPQHYPHRSRVISVRQTLPFSSQGTGCHIKLSPISSAFKRMFEFKKHK
jgi:hypothetical protein